MKQVIAIDLAKRVFQIHIPASGNRPAVNKVLTRNKLLAFIANQPESIIVWKPVEQLIIGATNLLN